MSDARYEEEADFQQPEQPQQSSVCRPKQQKERNIDECGKFANKIRKYGFIQYSKTGYNTGCDYI